MDLLRKRFELVDSFVPVASVSFQRLTGNEKAAVVELADFLELPSAHCFVVPMLFDLLVAKTVLRIAYAKLLSTSSLGSCIQSASQPGVRP